MDRARNFCDKQCGCGGHGWSPADFANARHNERMAGGLVGGGGLPPALRLGVGVRPPRWRVVAFLRPGLLPSGSGPVLLAGRAALGLVRAVLLHIFGSGRRSPVVCRRALLGALGHPAGVWRRLFDGRGCNRRGLWRVSQLEMAARNNRIWFWLQRRGFDAAWSGAIVVPLQPSTKETGCL